MAKVKLDLKSKTDAEILELANHHITEMTGNANFPTPSPSAADFAATTTTATDALAAADTAYTAWRTAVATKDAAIVALKDALTGRAAYVDSASSGDEAQILSAGFTTRAEAAPIGLPTQPRNLMAAMGSLDGTIELDWDNVRGAMTYLVECKEHNDAAAWQQVKIVTRSDVTVTGLTTGTTYAFRVRAVGAAGEGPWSDIAIKMAP